MRKSTPELESSFAGLTIQKRNPDDKIIALAGNPNVGKSTVFNALTGLHQHTGNWPGKTVSNAQGYCHWNEKGYILVDIPGSYSLMARSAEEEVARDFICFGDADAVIVVCDATCLERNLNLALQVMETGKRTILCVNLMDEARKRHMTLNLPLLSSRLGIPVVEAAARSGKGIHELMNTLEEEMKTPGERTVPSILYPGDIEQSIQALIPVICETGIGTLNARWAAGRMLDGDESLYASMADCLGFDLLKQTAVIKALSAVRTTLNQKGYTPTAVKDAMAAAMNRTAAKLCRDVVTMPPKGSDYRDRRLDRLFTSRLTGFPIMLLILLAVFWLTISGANVPSALLADGLFWLEDRLAEWLTAAGMAPLLIDVLIHGVYKVVAWVVSVMLPPMAIFFPLFTLLEDFGYLPRVAFNLDRCFKGCAACGKQALTMCMGFGCNAAGVTGCRIIDSPRERLIAIITNNFVPCNGRFPTIISIITMFLIGGASGLLGSFLGAVILVAVIVFGVCMTLLVSKLLSLTILKGIPSSFTLELPPYRRPQVGKVIIRSILDRTLKILGRALLMSAPAGLLIWVMANVSIGGGTLLSYFTGFLDPFGRALGMDGVILTGFILGLPANEIVVPVIIMTYLSEGSLVDIGGSALMQLLVNNGWTWITAVSTILFSLMHWPCATTCFTIRKETQSFKWMLVSFLVPTACGIIICFLFNTIVTCFH